VNLAEKTGAVMLDVRHQNDFAKSHIPRSIFIGLNGGFAPWVGALIKDVKQPIILIAEEDKVEEAVTRLSRVGFDNVIGYLKGGVEAWTKDGREVDQVASITANDLYGITEKNSEAYIVDVRKGSEYLSEHVKVAHNSPLSTLNEHLSSLPETETFYVHCAGGYRSMIAASILKSRGVHNFMDVLGGFKSIKETDISVSDFVCPTTL